MKDLASEIIAAQLGKTWLFSVGQAGFVVKSATGHLLGIDLCLSDCVEPLEGHVGFKRLLPKILDPKDLTFDVLVATHEHYDHFDVDAMPTLMSNGRTKLFASTECRSLVEKGGIDSSRVTYVAPGDSGVCSDFTFDFTTCDHGKGAPDAFGVIVTVDGKRIFETGDTCLRLDCVPEYQSHGPLDALIAPINGAFGNMNEQDCAQLADALKPKVTIPCHYGMFASHGGNLGAFHDLMRTQHPTTPYLMMTQGEKYEL